MTKRTFQEGMLSDALRRLLDAAVVGDPPVRGAAMYVEAPSYGFGWKGASGVARPGDGVSMLPDELFHAASITKMVTAVTVLRLVEEGRLALDAPIADYLPAAVTRGLHEYGGRSYGGTLTLRQLLNHTSGLADYFIDGGRGRRGHSAFFELLLDDPDRLWDPAEIVSYVRANLTPKFPPGMGWYYNDTGYLVAGLIVEAVSGRRLHEVCREHVLRPLGMERSHFAFGEGPRHGVGGRGESQAFVGDIAYSTMRSASADWAGGGLVTTAVDLSLFLRSVAEGRAFRGPSVRGEMFRWVRTGESGVEYGLGVRRFLTGELGMAGFGEVWGHTGFLKSFAFYWPELDATICGTLNQSAAKGVWSEVRPVASVVPGVMRELKRHLTRRG